MRARDGSAVGGARVEGKQHQTAPHTPAPAPAPPLPVGAVELPRLMAATANIIFPAGPSGMPRASSFASVTTSTKANPSISCATSKPACSAFTPIFSTAHWCTSSVVQRQTASSDMTPSTTANERAATPRAEPEAGADPRARRPLGAVVSAVRGASEGRGSSFHRYLYLMLPVTQVTPPTFLAVHEGAGPPRGSGDSNHGRRVPVRPQ